MRKYLRNIFAALKAPFMDARREEVENLAKTMNKHGIRFLRIGHMEIRIAPAATASRENGEGVQELVVPFEDLALPPSMRPATRSEALPHPAGLPYMGEPAIKTDPAETEDELLFWSSEDDMPKDSK